ncbi:MAG: type II toxin-antitoxin system RelE/ParE family toxin [Gammaproteobacteria bacterium]|jgi:plasmid stabilization system protein ParE|nr:type II toxin-antitoxin system RelE/ParE family toxin [Gammaproteobacteria bacterium]MBT5636299.1 type II toxin-antitoxin system RelE/ParE family toxin [Gammaproteobacteria bacterium]MBT5747520.1 type II toxin-antitoxin system RelE/ParE family toxin [Gammaproteobacteria bacterium]MBT7023505.1 type II toxin-antitoxin system RelE/ParE family toxin [Gammaproteobacteria bacterium]
MSFTFHPDAEAELNHTIDYYEDIEPGLGYDFATEIYTAIKRAEQFPRSWAQLDSEIRRSLAHRFPYGVLYSEEEHGNIYVIAVMHLHRHPDYWKDRNHH